MRSTATMVHAAAVVPTFITPSTLQVMHTQQVEDRKQLVAACAQIDDMYDSLAAHEQKVCGAR